MKSFWIDIAWVFWSLIGPFKKTKSLMNSRGTGQDRRRRAATVFLELQENNDATAALPHTQAPCTHPAPAASLTHSGQPRSYTQNGETQTLAGDNFRCSRSSSPVHLSPAPRAPWTGHAHASGRSFPVSGHHLGQVDHPLGVAASRERQKRREEQLA